MNKNTLKSAGLLLSAHTSCIECLVPSDLMQLQNLYAHVKKKCKHGEPAVM